MDKELKFSIISSVVSFIGLGIIIASGFLESTKIANTLTLVAFGILIIQKIVEIKLIKRTRKISTFILILLIISFGLFLSKIIF